MESDLNLVSNVRRREEKPLLLYRQNKIAMIIITMYDILSICYMPSILTIDKYNILCIMAAIFAPTWCKQTINGVYSQLFFDGVYTQLAVLRLGDVASDARSDGLDTI